MRRLPWIIPLLAAICLAFLPIAGLPSDDHEEARRAVLRGELKPLSEILAKVEAEFAGRVLEVQLERHGNNRLVYEIELLTPAGRVLELKYDGRTGERLSMRGGTGREHGRRPR